MTETTTSPHDAIPRFDDHGRRIPSRLKAAVEAGNRRYFVCDQPELDLDKIHARIRMHLAPDAALSNKAFATRVASIRQKLAENLPIAGVLRGVCVPFFLPRFASRDIGCELDGKFLPAVEAAYRETCPGYDFLRHHKQSLSGKLKIAPGSRHQHLIDTMSETEVVGCYFPCLPGFSLPAAIEQMESLPELLLLAGGFDTCAAFVGSPTLLLREDGYPPLLWFAALMEENANVGYHLEAYGYNLTFNRRAHLGHAAEYWSSGLVVLG